MQPRRSSQATIDWFPDYCIATQSESLIPTLFSALDKQDWKFHAEIVFHICIFFSWRIRFDRHSLNKSSFLRGFGQRGLCLPRSWIHFLLLFQEVSGSVVSFYQSPQILLTQLLQFLIGDC